MSSHTKHPPTSSHPYPSTPTPTQTPPLLPSDPVGQHFCHYFPHGWNFIYAPVPANGKPRWLTEIRYPLQPRPLWRHYTNPDTLIGLRFGKTTRYGLLDIDRNSFNHPRRCPTNFKAILGVLEDMGIVRTLLVQSSPSGGIHIYFFLPEPVSSFELACALKYSLAEQGYWLEDGRLEIFPNVKTYNPGQPSNYKAHRLPLQSGSCMVDDDLNPIPGDIAQFLAIADTQSQCQDLERLRKVMATALADHKTKTYHRTQSNRAQQWREDLESQMHEGWTDSGQTNILLKVIGTFGRVFEGLETLEELTKYIYEQAQHLPGFKKYCQHVKDLGRRARDWAKSIFGYYSPYCSQPVRRGSYKQTLTTVTTNEQRQQDARARITRAMQHLVQTQSLPATISARAAAIQKTSKTLCAIGVSKQTLYRQENFPLWHPQYDKLDLPTSEHPGHSEAATPAPAAEESEAETPDPPPADDCSDPPPYEGLLLSSGAPAPHSAGRAMSQNLKQGEREGETDTDSQPEAAPSKLDIHSDQWQLAKLKAKCTSQALKRTRSGGDCYPGKNASPDESKRCKILAKMLSYWESGHLALIAEVKQWLAAPTIDLTEAQRARFC